MDANKQREIASKGGKAAHKLGTAHQFTPDEARVAGRKGGEAVSQNRQHMSTIGRLGGEASRQARQSSRTNKERQDMPSPHVEGREEQPQENRPTEGFSGSM